jgi:hypothetical protein
MPDKLKFVGLFKFLFVGLGGFLFVGAKRRLKSACGTVKKSEKELKKRLTWGWGVDIIYLTYMKYM